MGHLSDVGCRKGVLSNLDSGTWNLESEIWNLGSGIWNLESGTWNLEPGTWNLEPGIWNLESGIWNLESGIMEPRICVRLHLYDKRASRLRCPPWADILIKSHFKKP